MMKVIKEIFYNKNFFLRLLRSVDKIKSNAKKKLGETYV